ncbi:EthD domain-containing protein [Microvirga terrestris]|uniref:EthD family reductase n=1 Tax=Microvirga terrestris TaxID=2791024 RepID=A0ABS0HV25_9HYPH|nr:EthD domain-containing protein [Microvirga terrestris]MBF9197332.1 EthD family reductase [Microvirga terrestris]
MGLLTRRPDVSQDEFRRHWREVHGPLVARLPSLQSYHQNHVVDDRQLAIDHARGSWSIDGISELWFDSDDDMKTALSSDEYKEVARDHQLLVGPTALITAVQNVVVPVDLSAEPLVKLISILTRKPGLTPEQFKEEWWGFHAEAVSKFPNLMGYAQNLVTGRSAGIGQPASYEAIPIDGVVELWFRSVTDIEAAFHSRAANVSQMHALSFISEITTFLVETHQVVSAGMSRKSNA